MLRFKDDQSFLFSNSFGTSGTCMYFRRVGALRAVLTAQSLVPDWCHPREKKTCFKIEIRYLHCIYILFR